jgi:hypothetical protein
LTITFLSSASFPAITLLNGVVSYTATEPLVVLNCLGTLMLRLFSADDLRIGLLGDFLRNGVFDFHHAVVQLSSIVALDRFHCGGSLHIDKRGRSQVLPVHVLVEVCVDQFAAVGEEFLIKWKSLVK